jgi:hypothetical protein
VLLSKKLTATSSVLQTIKARLQRNAKTLQRGRNGEILQEIQLALEQMNSKRKIFKTLLLAFATKSAPPINEMRKSQSFGNFVVLLTLCEVENADKGNWNIKSIVLVSGMVDGAKTSSLNQQSMLHMYLYRKFFKVGQVCFFDPIASNMGFIHDDGLHAVLVSGLKNVVSCHDMKKWSKMDSIYMAEELVKQRIDCFISIVFLNQKKNFVELSASILGLENENNFEISCLQSIATFDTCKTRKKAYNLKKMKLDEVQRVFESKDLADEISIGLVTVLGKLEQRDGDLFLNIVTENESSVSSNAVSLKLCLESLHSDLNLPTLSLLDYMAKFYSLNQDKASKIRSYCIGFKNDLFAVKNFRHVSLTNFDSSVPRVRTVNRYSLLYDQSVVLPTIPPSEMLRMKSILRKANQVQGFAFNSKSSYAPSMEFKIGTDQSQELDSLLSKSRTIKNEAIKLTVYAHLFGQMLSFAAGQIASGSVRSGFSLSSSFDDLNSLKLDFKMTDWKGQVIQPRTVQDSACLLEWGPLMSNHARSNGVWDSDRLSGVLSAIFASIRASTFENQQKFLSMLKTKDN